MDDPGHEAEHDDVDSQPQAPHEVGGPLGIRPGEAPANDQAGADRGQRERQQPGDLAPELGVEQPQQPRRPRETASTAPATAETAAALAEDPAETVIAEQQLDNGVVRAAADVGAISGRDELHDGHPPAARPDDSDEGDA